MERVLKLGLTQIAKEYQCVRPPQLLPIRLSEMPQCPTCPEPATCARLLEEKWRQAYHAIFRFGRFYFTLSTLSHSLPICRAVSTIYGVPIPQDARGRHPAAQSDTPQLPDHG